MNRGIAFPFLTLSDAAVNADPWRLSLNRGDWQKAGDFVDGWDAASEIRVRRTLKVDPHIAAADLGVSARTLRLALSVRVGTGPGRLPRRIVLRERRELDSGTWREEIELSVPGDRLALVLDLRTDVILADLAGEAGRLSPQRIGDRLWSDTVRPALEGEETRFPLEVADLRKLLGDVPAAGAPWFLHWSPVDWHRDFHGAARVYLNRERPDVIGRIEEQDGLTLQALLADVIGQVCERLLNDEEADSILAEEEPGALGAEATTWLRSIWPGKDAAFMRSVLEQRPAWFRASVLELAELGDGEG